MSKKLILLCCFISFILGLAKAQEVDFHLERHLLVGKIILKVKRDFKDPYLWVLAENNEIFRINSQTYEVNDYTLLFSSFNDLNFIDIAGENKDLFFIATDTNTLLLFKQNTIKIISTADGLIEPIKSIGIDFIGTFDAISANLLMIGTISNNYRYNIDTDQLIPNPSSLETDIYIASYSKLMHSGYPFNPSNNDLTYLPVIFRVPQTTYLQFLWKDALPYGPNINTAYYTYTSVGQNYAPNLYSGEMANLSNLFWGNENGMFQISRNRSDNSSRPKKQHLNGIKVNKINSIYGLSSFGTPVNFDYGVVRENLLVGTNKGLYYGTNMYKNYDYDSLLDFSLIKYSPLSDTKINDINGNCASIQPFCEDGAWIATDNGIYFLKSDYSELSNTITSNTAKFTSNTNLTEMEFCTGTEATAKVEIDIFGNSIQWYKNNLPIDLATDAELKITETGSYHALIYNSCSNIYIKTNALVAKFASQPAFTFNYPDNIDLCKGAAFTFYTTQKTGYSYRWFKDNIEILNALTSNYATTLGGKYRVEVSSCSNQYYPSKEVNVSIIDIPKPIIKSQKNSYCEGDLAELSIEPNNLYKIAWMKEGIRLPNFDGLSTISTFVPGKYIAIYEFDAICSKHADAYNLSFGKIPVFEIVTNSGKVICEGKEATLKADITGVKYLWSTGEETQNIKVSKSGNYSVEVTNLSGCKYFNEIEIDVVSALKPSEIPNMVICTIKNGEIKLTADLGFKNYSWNGYNGSNPYFTVNKPGKYELIVTDYNNCSASTKFEVLPWCEEITIPNAFSPNGDGVNDVWKIGGLENNKNVKVIIYDRNGSKVYESNGLFISWDGTSLNKALPIATYFYIITSQNTSLPLKGSITIIK